MIPIRSTQCGHNFCEKCLVEMSVEEGWACPECRQIHHCLISDLARGYFIEKCVEKFKKKEKQPISTHISFGTCKNHNRGIEISEFQKSLRKFKVKHRPFI